MRLAIIVGTRPEIIKMSPLIREAQSQQLDFLLVHTGQHYSYSMDEVFFSQLKLPKPDVHLDVGSGLHGEQSAKILAGLESAFLQSKPDVVLVQGDTNTVLAGALAAVKLHISVGHVEAGLRSYDRSMPEEINRVLTDHISEYLFAPTQTAKTYLQKEGIDACKIFVVGNTVTDAVFDHIKLVEPQAEQILSKYGLSSKKYFLVTAHRAENVDSKEKFLGLLSGLQNLAKETGYPVFYPIHPRAQKMITQFGLDSSGLTLIEPVDYLSMLCLQKHAAVVLTDSGGLQEESCILKTPCVTLRENTERPETLEIGANVLAGTDPEKIVSYAQRMLSKNTDWTNPYGDGTTAQQILSLFSENQRK